MILDRFIKFQHPQLETPSSMFCSVCLSVLQKGSLALLLSFMAFSLSGVHHAIPALLLDLFSRTNHLFSSRQSNNAALGASVY